MSPSPSPTHRAPHRARDRATRWWLALCALVALLAGCADDPTRVYVTVEADAALAVDGLVVIAGPDDHRPMPYTARVALQVPDAWADAPHTVTFEGTHGGDVVARGSVTFTPRAHAAIEVTVHLAPLGQCDATCEPGATRCTGGAEAVETCVVGTDGCPAWGAADVCAGATPFCADGACVATCQDDCTTGATECDGTGGVRTCGNYDGDACLEWSTTTACGADQACTAGACVATVPLTVTKEGSGSGTVTSPAGIDCGATCTARFLPGTMVSLTATPATGATFTGWSGGCTGTGTCTVTLTAATAVTATFTGACINECTASATTCTSPSTQAACGNFDADACTEWGPATTCGVNQVCAGAACVATAIVAVTKAGSGAGTVVSTPPGITCGTDCSEAFVVGTGVQLMATPATGSTFTGWSGGCTGTGACVITAATATSVTATFTGPCTDECTTGAASCPTTSTERTCGNFDADACLEWSPPVACAAGEVCAGTACVATAPLTVATTGTGTGTVTSNLPGIDCGADCTEAYPVGTMVTLTARPDATATFTGWAGAGAGTGTCTVTLAAATSVTATFAPACGTTTCGTETLAMPTKARGLVADATHLYWINGSNIERRAKAGGPVGFVAASFDLAWSLAIDDAYVYWTTAYDVWRLPKIGGAIERLAHSDSFNRVQGFAIDDTDVYWWTITSPAIRRVAKTGGAIATFQDFGSSAVTFWVALDSTYVYWFEGGLARRKPKAGGPVESLGSVGGYSWTVDATHIYWSGGGTLYRMLKGGGAIEVIAGGQASAGSITLDATHVYWTNSAANGQVMRRLKAGGAVETVSSGQPTPEAVVVDATHIYWATSTSDTSAAIVRLARCACNL